MLTLAPLDIAIVVGYVLAMALLGVWFTRRQRTLRTYFVGDRDVAWWLILISIVTTETSAVTFLSVPGVSYAAGGDMTFLQLAFGWDTFVQTGGEAGKFTVLNFTPDLSQPFTFWAGLIGGAFFTMASHGADQMMVQRYLCSRSLGEARAALVLSGFTVLLQFVLFLLVGVGLFVLVQVGQMSPPSGTRNDEVFGYFIVNNLPVGL